MVVREVGILFRGFNIVHREYTPVDSDVDKDLRAGMFTAILSFCSEGFGDEVLDCLSFHKYTMVFSSCQIVPTDLHSDRAETLVAYAIVDKEKSKGAVKKLKKKLAKILDRFKSEFVQKVKTYSEITQFKGFEFTLDGFFKSEKHAETRLKNVL
ncbi:MAG: hypothetical protein ACTSU5_17575 [Promethearchaeota archaeon]